MPSEDTAGPSTAQTGVWSSLNTIFSNGDSTQGRTDNPPSPPSEEEPSSPAVIVEEAIVHAEQTCTTPLTRPVMSQSSRRKRTRDDSVGDFTKTLGAISNSLSSIANAPVEPPNRLSSDAEILGQSLRIGIESLPVRKRAKAMVQIWQIIATIAAEDEDD